MAPDEENCYVNWCIDQDRPRLAPLAGKYNFVFLAYYCNRRLHKKIKKIAKLKTLERVAFGLKRKIMMKTLEFQKARLADSKDKVPSMGKKLNTKQKLGKSFSEKQIKRDSNVSDKTTQYSQNQDAKWIVVGEMSTHKTLSKFEKTARWQNIQAIVHSITVGD